MKKLKIRLLYVFVCCWTLAIGCSKINPDTASGDYFTQWNPCEALTALQEYVQDVTNSASVNYIRPEDLRIKKDLLADQYKAVLPLVGYYQFMDKYFTPHYLLDIVAARK